jgi:hypothetical protein
LFLLSNAFCLLSVINEVTYYRHLYGDGNKYFKLGMKPVLHHTFPFLGKVKDKHITVTGYGGPQACETSRIQYFLDNQLTDGYEVVSLRTGRTLTPHPKRFLVLIPVNFSRQPHKVFTLLSRRGATEHSSTRPRFSTHNLLIVFECMYTDCK